MLSYAVAGLVCVFAALCYSEFAAMVPVAGSAYTYAYATLGELFAWIIGWDLLLEYAVSAATVADGWSGYFQNVLNVFGWKLPRALAGPVVNYDPQLGKLVATGSYVNLPSVVIVLLLTAILVVGIKESAGFNSAMVLVNLGVVLTVIGVGAAYVDPANWHPFLHEDTGRLVDIPNDRVRVAELPTPPEGTAISGVEVIVRLASTNR